MSDKQIGRREMLSGLAMAGGAGALVGSGTTAFFSDEETFVNNNIEASSSVAGVVDIGVAVESLENGTGVTYTTTLPDSGNNNPSYICVRTKTCPDEFADALRVRLRFCDGAVLVGSVREVLDYLASGRLLTCDAGASCLQPGESVSLELDVVEVLDPAALDEELSFELEFSGQQCRYTDIETSCAAGTECNPPDGKGISFIAFCSESGDPDPEIVEVLAEDEDEGDVLRSVVWETQTDVKYVVVKAGQTFTIYDYSDLVVTRAVATTGGNTAAEYFGDLCDVSLGDCVSDSGGGSGQGASPNSNGNCNENNRSSEPCALASDVFGHDCFKGTSVKLEYEDGTFEEADEEEDDD